MANSIFDLFKIGLGPSRSHTVGSRVVGNRFIKKLIALDKLPNTNSIQINLYGSLALTGKGHSTDSACILGLMSKTLEDTTPDMVPKLLNEVASTNRLIINSHKLIKFNAHEDIIFNFNELLPQHPNNLTMSAYNALKEVLLEQAYFSTGGGFVLNKDELNASTKTSSSLPFAFDNAKQSLDHCQQSELSINQLTLANEKAIGTKNIIDNISAIWQMIWQVMSSCIERNVMGAIKAINVVAC